MASKPLRPCRHPGCTELVRGGYCQKHTVDRHSAASREWHRWYSLPIWTRDLRPGQLLREPFCQDPDCPERRLTGRPARATDVDHVIPHEGDWELFTDRNNLRSLCHGCHSRKTMRETKDKISAMRR